MDRGSFRFALLALAGYVIFLSGIIGNATEYTEISTGHALTVVGGLFGFACHLISMLKYNAAQRIDDNVSS